MNEPTEINEIEVELCVELGRLYDMEDLTHPPHTMIDNREKEEEDE